MVEFAAPAVRDWDFPRSTASVLLMSSFAAEHGDTAVLAGTSLTPEQVRDPEAQIDAGQELAVVRNVQAGLPPGRDPDAAAIALGRRYHVTTFGIFGFACISSPTLADTMAFALRYLDLSFTFSIPHVAVDGGEIRLVLHDELVPADVARFLVLRDLSAIYTVMGDLLSPITLRRVELRFAEPSTVDSYVAAFGVRPVFGGPVNLVTLDAAYLDRPLPQANLHTVAICEAQCREMVTRRRARTGISHQVRERLIRLGGADTGMDAIARELMMSPRTLRRRLTEAGTSYRALVDEVREALAEELLATGVLSVEEVAVRLGYAEASSFIYAFKRWKGVTPAAYARALGRTG
ncbi:AraC family transcriptional regulator [Amycolatopsis magusensis]|uniref:AraC family transcriptional regulator n=1 Tax=Amycolatopsis magusensis TaxID=882444 RepID=UPI0024A9F69D|nr:AraC family transcriptional regulator [Amycolatopsis magusensis]MDI5980301.1 AraC family transcriptional regulator [Amycolatopsis magusensis]